MQDNNSSNKKAFDTPVDETQKEQEAPHKHNPFEEKNDTLTKEEEESIEQFKEAQTERD